MLNTWECMNELEHALNEQFVIESSSQIGVESHRSLAIVAVRDATSSVSSYSEYSAGPDPFEFTVYITALLCSAKHARYFLDL